MSQLLCLQKILSNFKHFKFVKFCEQLWKFHKQRSENIEMCSIFVFRKWKWINVDELIQILHSSELENCPRTCGGKTEFADFWKLQIAPTLTSPTPARIAGDKKANSGHTEASSSSFWTPRQNRRRSYLYDCWLQSSLNPPYIWYFVDNKEVHSEKGRRHGI